MSNESSRRAPGIGLALLPIATMFVLLVGSLAIMPLTSDLIVIAMIGSAAVAGVIAIRQGATFDDIQRVAGEKVAGVLPALLILLSIGMLIALWVMSGTIPFLVYWGVRLVNPQYLVLTAFLASVLMSSFTGTSWGSAGTIGVAMIGTAVALGAPLPIVAGAVVSGAYFGDKMSPLSDSTIIASVAADVDLYVHIRHLTYTAGPSFVLSLIVYTLVGGHAASSSVAVADGGRTILSDLDRVYSLGWYTMIPPAIVIVAIVRRVPAVIAIAVSSAVAGVIAVVAQHFTVSDVVTAAVAGFKLPMIAATGVDPASMSDAFGRLVQRGGLNSMATTLVLVFAAFLLAAAMEVSGSLTVLVTSLLRAVRSTFGLIASTMMAGLTMIGLTSHGGVTMLIVGNMFQPAYRERGLAPQNLSRSLEDSVTITEPLMPWTVSAVFMATTLGVPTVQYAPWAVFCYSGPVMSLLLAALYNRTKFGLAPLVAGKAVGG
jgi:NhaC family Na+:H+ antiporter